jgi:hypothetical protein
MKGGLARDPEGESKSPLIRRLRARPGSPNGPTNREYATLYSRYQTLCQLALAWPSRDLLCLWENSVWLTRLYRVGD